jgi:hypothetical protein
MALGRVLIKHSDWSSAFGDKPDILCSFRAFPLLTQGHRRQTLVRRFMAHRAALGAAAVAIYLVRYRAHRCSSISCRSSGHRACCVGFDELRASSLRALGPVRQREVFLPSRAFDIAGQGRHGPDSPQNRVLAPTIGPRENRLFAFVTVSLGYRAGAIPAGYYPNKGGTAQQMRKMPCSFRREPCWQPPPVW